MKARMIRLSVAAVLVVAGFVFVEPTQALAVTRTWTGAANDGNWNNATNWGGTAPVATDSALIPGGLATTYPNINNTVTIVNVTVNNTSTGATVTVSTAGTFTVNGTMTISSTGTLTVSGGSLTLLGLTLSSGGTFTHSGGSVTFDAGGNWMNNGGTFTPGTNTVTFTGGGNPDINGTATSQTFNNLVVNKTAGTSLAVTGSTATFTVNDLTETAGNFTPPATLNINGNFLHTAGTFNPGPTINIKGDWTQNGGTQTVAGGDTVTFNGSAAQNINGSAATTFDSLIINNSAGVTNNHAAATTVDDTLTLTSGTFTLTTALTFSAGVTNISRANGSLSGTTPTFLGTTNVTYTGATGPITTGIELPTGATVLANLTINDAGQTVTLNANVTVNGTFAVTAGTFDTSGSSFAVTFNGSFTNSGTFTANGSNITIGGSAGNPSIAGFSTTGALSFTRTSGTATLTGGVTAASLTMNGGGTLNLGTTLSHQINGDVTFTTGTLNGGSSTLSLTGNFTGNGGTFTASTSTVNFNGSASQTINRNVAIVFNNLTINNAAGVILNHVTGATTVNGTATLTLTAGTFTLTTALTLGNGADIVRNVGSLSAAPTFGTSVNVTYTGSTGVTSGPEIPAAAGVLSNLTINKTGGVTLGASLTVNGVLALNSADITTGANTLNMAVGATSSASPLPGFDVVGNVTRTHAFANGTPFAFGNQFVTISFTGAGTKPTAMTVILEKGSAPNNFTNAVQRIYSISPTGGTGFSATLQLHYLDTELNGNAEGSLQLWREAVTTWSLQGFTARNSTDNWVSLTGVTGFSRWAIADSDAPTDVAMVKMKATRFDNRVLLEWQTGYEVRNLGFNIYREQKGSYSRINPEPVAGSALLFGPKVALSAGFAYAWWDREIADCGLGNADCENTRYWIEDMDLSGHTSIHGPFGVERPASGEAASAAGKVQAPLLGAIGSDAAKLGSSAPVERLARILKPTAAGLIAQASLASQQAVKLSVKHEGWYRVEQSDLVAAGFPANADALKLQLFVDGQQVPILITSAGASPGKGGFKPISAPWDGIEFYGLGIDSAFTDSHVYWLVAGSQNGLRINTVPSNGGSPAPAAFPFSVERRDKVVYFPSLHNGGAEKFFGPVVYDAQPVDQSVTLQHVASAGTATLDVSLQGYTDAPHSVSVLLNGSQLGTVQFDGLAKAAAQYSVPQSSLLEGSNQIQFISPAGFSDITMVEFVRMTYQHTNTADSNSIRFPATGSQQATITGFSTAAVRVMDVTDPSSPQEVTASVAADGATFSATVTVPGAGARSLLAFAADQKKTPAALVANQPSSWRSPANGANYIAVTRKDLISSIQPLVNQRKNQGLKTSLVDIEDLYDEFSFGNKTPQALKDFFSYTKTTWKIAPRFALLAGDATYDPKNYTGVGDNDVIPTRLFEANFSETATDDWFVDLDGDAVPDIAIGRLPVRSAQEASALVAKIVRFDRSAANPRVLLVADHNDGYDFEAADTQLQSLIPANLSIIDIRRGQVGDSIARTQLLDALHFGAKFVNYYGHGSTLVWTNASILTADDAPNLVNTDRLALFDAMTCFNGFFHDVSIDSLGEALLKAPGGAIAVWASSGMTDAGGQVLMNEEAIRQLFSGAGLTIGEVTARAKAATGNSDVRRTWILLGDPATRLR